MITLAYFKLEETQWLMSSDILGQITVLDIIRQEKKIPYLVSWATCTNHTYTITTETTISLIISVALHFPAHWVPTTYFFLSMHTANESNNFSRNTNICSPYIKAFLNQNAWCFFIKFIYCFNLSYSSKYHVFYAVYFLTADLFYLVLQ